MCGQNAGSTCTFRKVPPTRVQHVAGKELVASHLCRVEDERTIKAAFNRGSDQVHTCLPPDSGWDEIAAAAGADLNDEGFAAPGHDRVQIEGAFVITDSGENGLDLAGQEVE